MNKPSEKQIALILKLTNGRYASDAYRAIGNVVGISASSAERRATMADASKTIDKLLKK